jgi:hypothetical protein
MSVIVAGVVAQTLVVQKMHKSIFVVRSPDQCLSMHSYVTLVRKIAVEKRPHYFVARVSGRGRRLFRKSGSQLSSGSPSCTVHTHRRAPERRASGSSASWHSPPRASAPDPNSEALMTLSMAAALLRRTQAAQGA